ncbi:L-aspartate oxidase [Haloplanus aerogenes]|uniref:FAD-dependent oxidoreductase n=1 Tax=Haloplanus aerogenes TaxID=660522 RepID=A0A3M0DVI7_9EURY|nr:FAD-dependent oxidoreductase [Haloplanus aerogenes]AZH24521.1 FAD-dependent oxidoreductase [Haloplanus aerogenes]RMB23829.1 succinate dehydrogenase / fumarate reductase flavoprotein subunit [Haloplanus aerogenes]
MGHFSRTINGETPESVAYETLPVRVLIVGAGAAGARTAIELVERGVAPEDILVVGKRRHGDAHTTWARGGINGALGTHDPDDDWTVHAADTLTEGHHVNDPDKVETVARRMPGLLRELDEWGMPFSRTDDGDIDQRYFGAQSFRRTAFAGDHTGESLLDTLVDRAQSLSIPYRENVFVSRLLTDADRVLGAAATDLDTGDFLLFDADIVVLAAGGYTSLYRRHSSRDDENTGDGPALAYAAGARLMDMEFIQFHPTGMVGARYGDEWDGRLVTEAVRGEGGHLYNAQDERFMERYSAEQMELDARDVVARAIDAELDAGRGTANGGVYLDISHRDRDFIRERLPRMYERFADLGVDMASDPVEVAPTAHYGMGGVVVDDVGETDVAGLYAIGETMAGVHGANRLGGNSLAETIAFGQVAGDAIAARLAAGDATDTPSSTLHDHARRHFAALETLADSRGSTQPATLLDDLRDLLWTHAGIHRDETGLAAGLDALTALRGRALDLDVGNPTSRSFEFALNLQFGLTVAEAILRSAHERTESRGAHHRPDHPETDPDWRRNVVVERGTLGSMALSTTTVGRPSDPVRTALDAGYELDYHQLE